MFRKATLLKEKLYVKVLWKSTLAVLTDCELNHLFDTKLRVGTHYIISTAHGAQENVWSDSFVTESSQLQRNMCHETQWATSREEMRISRPWNISISSGICPTANEHSHCVIVFVKVSMRMISTAVKCILCSQNSHSHSCLFKQKKYYV